MSGMPAQHQNSPHPPASLPQNQPNVHQWNQNPGFLNSESWLHSQQATGELLIRTYI